MSGHPPLDPELFDEPEGKLWVMHCADGPVPRAAAEAARSFLPRETRPWRLRWEQDFQALPRETKAAAAEVLGARAEDLSLTATTSTGLVTIAQGLDWRPGDEVLAPLGEFPANAWPWKALERRGVRFREVPLWEGHRAGREAWASAPPPAGADPESRLIDAIRPETRVLAASWVRFQDGLRLDLPRLAAASAERRVHLVVDGIQGAGTLEGDLRGVAAFVSGGHKGLLAPQGLALLWTDPALRAELTPSGSWLSVEESTDFERPSTDLERSWCPDGSRLEAGVPNLLACAAMRESLRLIGAAGVGAIAEHVGGLQERLLAGLASLPGWRGEAGRLAELQAGGRLGSILSLHHGGRGPEALAARLKAGFAGGIFASVREGYLRIALHGWHRPRDVGRLLEWLAAPER